METQRKWHLIFAAHFVWVGIMTLQDGPLLVINGTIGSSYMLKPHFTMDKCLLFLSLPTFSCVHSSLGRAAHWLLLSVQLSHFQASSPALLDQRSSLAGRERAVFQLGTRGKRRWSRPPARTAWRHRWSWCRRRATTRPLPTSRGRKSRRLVCSDSRLSCVPCKHRRRGSARRWRRRNWRQRTVPGSDSVRGPVHVLLCSLGFAWGRLLRRDLLRFRMSGTWTAGGFSRWVSWRLHRHSGSCALWPMELLLQGVSRVGAAADRVLAGPSGIKRLLAVGPAWVFAVVFWSWYTVPDVLQLSWHRCSSYIHTGTYKHTYIRTYIHTYIDTYISAYTHTQMNIQRSISGHVQGLVLAAAGFFIGLLEWSWVCRLPSPSSVTVIRASFVLTTFRSWLIQNTTCHKLSLVIACCLFSRHGLSTQKCENPMSSKTNKASWCWCPPRSQSQTYVYIYHTAIPCLHLHWAAHMAPMNDSGSGGGHAGAQVVPRGKPARGQVPPTPRGRQGLMLPILMIYRSRDWMLGSRAGIQSITSAAFQIK